ncbi:hypothetical protein T492DRAFT_111446 [Pavlovales sp. CCMP2436]|nr:hypothetical protein T492DRAFT_111446 [Pavlovales sp. CCMP2436]
MDWYVHKNFKAFALLGFRVNHPPDDYDEWLRALSFEIFSSRVQEATFPWSWKYPPSEGDIVNMLVPLWSRRLQQFSTFAELRPVPNAGLETVMGRIDPELPLVRGNIKILVNNDGRSMAATLLDIAELERRRDTITSSAGVRAPAAQYCNVCRHPRHGKGGCHVGLCAGGCVKVCSRCLHADHGTFTCTECPGAAESLKCSPRCHVCLQPGTRATYQRAEPGCVACSAGSGCSAVPLPPPPQAVTPAGMDVLMTNAEPVCSPPMCDETGADDGEEAGGGEDRGGVVDSSSSDDEEEEDEDYASPLRKRIRSPATRASLTTAIESRV